MNHMTLSAQLVARKVSRQTPAGLSVCDFSLQHESQVSEAGQLRQVSFYVNAVAFGDVANQVLKLNIGSESKYVGFFTNQRNGKGALFHVTQFE
jgi:primosomal replication protein N